MQAERVWHVWRRILRDPGLQDAVFAGDYTRFEPQEREIAQAYAATPAGTRFFIANYRFRLKSSFINALETAAPLTHRLLRAHGVDLDAVSVRFLDSVQWQDFGPYVFTYAGWLLDFLVAQPELAAIEGLPELAAVERAGVRVTIAAADFAAATDPGRHRLATPAEFVHCGRSLSGWLREPRRIGREPLPNSPSGYVVFLRQPDMRRRIVAVPPATGAALATFDTQDTPHDAAALAALVKLGVVLPPER